MKYRDIPKYTSQGQYNPQSSLKYFLGWLNEQIAVYNLELNPDFQRGYVWTESQQVKYIEHLLKEGKNANTFYFNCAGWMGDWEGDFVCVDGLQRITAIQRFMNNEIRAFDHYLDEYEDKDYLLRAIRVTTNVNNLKTRKEVLQWYIEFNSGGTVHTEDEIDRVKELLKKEIDI